MYIGYDLGMSDSEDLESRVKRLENLIVGLPQKILMDAKKMMDLHDHAMGSRVIWRLPPEALKKLIESMKPIIEPSPPHSNFSETVEAHDLLKTKLTPVG